MNIIDEVGQITDNLRYTQEKFLRSKGWEATCVMPDSCWRWVKTMDDGRVFVMSFSEAYDVEIYIEEMRLDEEEAQKQNTTNKGLH